MTSDYVFGVVGNPNCGKTTLFNALTGAKQRVGNWPGVTVERKTGQYGFSGTRFQVVDLPGTYSLDVTQEAVSLDEKIARDYVLSGQADLIVNIVDASNLERNLYLTVQLAEMQVPLVVVLNMMDVARERGVEIDVEGLSQRLGCPVVPVVASEGEGIKALKKTILRAVQDRPVPSVQVGYPTPIETALEVLLPVLREVAAAHQVDARWLAVKLLEGDGEAKRIAANSADGVLPRLEADLAKALDEDVDIAMADGRYGTVGLLTRDTVRQVGKVGRPVSDRIDRVVLNRALGIPIFLVIMYLMFMFTINVGGAFIDFFDIVAGTVFVEGFAWVLGILGAPEWLTLGLADGIGGGIQVVATFIPIIGFLYVFLAVLEDSGYMARAAFVMDRFLRFVGLPGKSFVPLLVGFGCNVPAIMATRTLEHQRDRLMTIAMNPFMSCGARLPVYALFAAAFFPVGGQNVVFGLYLIGIAVAILTGLILKNTLLKGETSPFIMELPSYHVPTLKGVMLRAWDRLKTFMFRAGKVIVPMVLVLNVLNTVGTDGSLGNEDTEQSVLAEVGRTITPAFSPMGLTEDNWPAAVGIFTGVLAKEAVVGTLNALYSQLAESDAGLGAAEQGDFDFWGNIGEAFATIPENLMGVTELITDPLGLDIVGGASPEAAAEAQEVSVSTFGAMASRFDGQAGAFAYLLFVLMYFPCVAAVAAVYRETNAAWTGFVAAWTTGMGYMSATIFYQAATFSQHPATSLSWIVGLLALFVGVVATLWYLGRQRERLPGMVVEKA
ncbi:MAG: Fe(2+) transporter permease subunit FeoB [Gammaproteobacteria bacterium]